MVGDVRGPEPAWLGAWQRQCALEHRSLSRRTLTSQGAPHRATEFSRDGQAQPAAAEASFVGAFGLLKWLKDAVDVVGRDADAGVADRQGEILITRLLKERFPDIPVIGEEHASEYGTPDEIGSICAWLAGEDSGFTTGADFRAGKYLIGQAIREMM